LKFLIQSPYTSIFLSVFLRFSRVASTLQLISLDGHTRYHRPLFLSTLEKFFRIYTTLFTNLQWWCTCKFSFYILYFWPCLYFEYYGWIWRVSTITKLFVLWLTIVKKSVLLFNFPFSC
jgi:hypothetical protein